MQACTVEIPGFLVVDEILRLLQNNKNTQCIP